MARATPGNLSESEWLLLRETTPVSMRNLDEDALIELHDRVRRARNKHVGVHRREVSARVEEVGARGKVSVPPRRSASKAELFEDGLARVSAAVARAARRSAKELRDDRLAMAKAERAVERDNRNARRTAAAELRVATSEAKQSARADQRRDRSQAASSRAQGARRQARRDAAG